MPQKVRLETLKFHLGHEKTEEAHIRWWWSELLPRYLFIQENVSEGKHKARCKINMKHSMNGKLFFMKTKQHDY